MQSVNVLQAKSPLFRLVRAVERGREREIIITHNGRPAAQLVPIDTLPIPQRLGIAKGKLQVPDDIDAGSEDVARLLPGTCRTTPVDDA